MIHFDALDFGDCNSEEVMFSFDAQCTIYNMTLRLRRLEMIDPGGFYSFTFPVVRRD